MIKENKDLKRVRIYLYAIFPYWYYYDNEEILVDGETIKVFKKDVWEIDCLFNRLFGWLISVFDFFNITIPSFFRMDALYWLRIPINSQKIIEEYEKKQDN